VPPPPRRRPHGAAARHHQGRGAVGLETPLLAAGGAGADPALVQAGPRALGRWNGRRSPGGGSTSWRPTPPTRRRCCPSPSGCWIRSLAVPISTWVAGRGG